MNDLPRAEPLARVALLGCHLPRQCGIATFTTHLADALMQHAPALDCVVLAMNDGAQRYAYPSRVRVEIAEDDLSSYHRAADFLNVNAIDVLCVQHEYGIFGGTLGAHVFALLRELRMPIVTTLHTILGEPTSQHQLAMEELTRLSDRLVVMSAHGASLLRSVYGVPPSKIDLIPHGIPFVQAERLAYGARAAAHGRHMTWPAVAHQYTQSFERAHADRRRRTSFQAQTLASRPARSPEINLAHLRRMTDDTGL